jgi:hypothetical protein
MEPLADIKSMVERIVSEVLESRLDQLRAEVVQRVEGELQPLLVQREGPTALLNVAVNAIQESATQTDILNSVLDGSTNFAARSILFVMRGDNAVAWNSRGFDELATNDLKLPATHGSIGEALENGTMQRAKAKAVLGDVLDSLGPPVEPTAYLLPMKVRERIPALLYADAGTSKPGRLDSNALQLLVRSAALWLEVISGRRGAHGQPLAAVEAPAASGGGAAGESWERAEPGGAPERIATSAVPRDHRPAPPIVPGERVGESAAELTGVPEPAPSGPDAEVHKRAKRFAKLLVDEIVLYNKQKVAEGREHRDLYDRLRDDIEKSRSAYNKRFGSSPAAPSDYFTSELVATLAENDPALLGSSFSR